MARTLTCDECKKTILEGEAHYFMTIVLTNHPTALPTTSTYAKDLCKDDAAKLGVVK